MSSNLTEPTMPGSVMANISHFDCDVLSSSLSLATRMLALAYLVKYHTVNVENTPIANGAESTRKRECGLV